jgi:hypothetical protein
LLKLSITRVYVSQALTDLIAGDIPSFKLFESDKILAYLDIQPLSKGHAVRPPWAASLARRGCSVALPIVRQILIKLERCMPEGFG